MEQLYHDTQKKVKYLKDRGFEVVEKWGCAFKTRIETGRGDETIYGRSWIC